MSYPGSGSSNQVDVVDSRSCSDYQLQPAMPKREIFVTLQHTATRYNTLQHTATHCNTLQHPATPCNTLQNAAKREISKYHK